MTEDQKNAKRIDDIMNLLIKMSQAMDTLRYRIDTEHIHVQDMVDDMCSHIDASRKEFFIHQVNEHSDNK